MRLVAALFGAILATVAQIIKLPLRVLFFGLFLVALPFALTYLSIKIGLAFNDLLWPVGPVVMTVASAALLALIGIGCAYSTFLNQVSETGF